MSGNSIDKNPTKNHSKVILERISTLKRLVFVVLKVGEFGWILCTTFSSSFLSIELLHRTHSGR